MAYVVEAYDLGDAIEHEHKFVGEYGSKGEKRAPKRKAIPEQMAKQNHANRIKKDKAGQYGLRS